MVNGEQLIAVVDDDSGMRTSLDGLVRSLGYTVAMFSAAEQLLSWPELPRAKCVISDIQMPNGLNGIALLRRLLAADSRKRVILISAFVNEQVRSEAIEAGAFAVLKKPFVGETLIEAIEAAMAR